MIQANSYLLIPHLLWAEEAETSSPREYPVLRNEPVCQSCNWQPVSPDTWRSNFAHNRLQTVERYYRKKSQNPAIWDFKYRFVTKGSCSLFIGNWMFLKVRQSENLCEGRGGRWKQKKKESRPWPWVYMVVPFLFAATRNRMFAGSVCVQLSLSHRSSYIWLGNPGLVDRRLDLASLEMEK